MSSIPTANLIPIVIGIAVVIMAVTAPMTSLPIVVAILLIVAMPVALSHRRRRT